MGLFHSKFADLETVPNCNTNSVMGVWFVVGVKPSPFEKTSSNATERYVRTTAERGVDYDVDIDFEYNTSDPINSQLKSMKQTGRIEGDDKDNSGMWTVRPKILPFVKIPYPIIALDDGDDPQWMVVGHQGRKMCWILSRKTTIDEALYDSLLKNMVDKHQYDLKGFRKVPQKWTKAERTKRNLEKEISDDVLVNE